MAATEPLRGTLIVSVLRGNDLVNKDSGAQGLSDPYVKLIATNHGKKQLAKYQTKTIDNNLNPIWNERFSVYAEEDTPCIMLDLEVLDEDAFGSHDPMGYVTIPVESNFKFEKDANYPLKARKKRRSQGVSYGHHCVS